MSKYNSIAFYGNSVYKGVRVWHEFLVEDEKRPVLHLLGPWKLQKQTFFHVLSFFGFTDDAEVVNACAVRRRSAPSPYDFLCIERDISGEEHRSLHREDVNCTLHTRLLAQQRFRPPRCHALKHSVNEISVGAFHVLFTSDSGSLFAYGGNKHGQLGLGDCEDRHYPELVPVDPVTHVGAGAYYSIISYAQGCFPTPPCLGVVGKNTSGQLGLFSNNLYLGRRHLNAHLGEPVFQNVFLTAHANVKQICAAWSHTLLLFEDGTVHASGLGFLGRLGLGDEQDRHEFTNVALDQQIEQVSAGETFSLFRSSCNTFFSGDNIITPVVVDSGALAVYAAHKRIISVKGSYFTTEVVVEQLEQDEIEILSETLEKINL